jgi:hypothetical protein
MNTATELEQLLADYLPQLQNAREDKYVIKPAAGKWSKKEIIGHLVDSAQNNLRRFIVAQYEEKPLIVYKQDSWVAINNYQERPLNELVQTWYLINKQIVSVLRNTPTGMRGRLCNTETVHSIEWLANDYVLHLKHHLHQVLDLTPIAYP